MTRRVSKSRLGPPHVLLSSSYRNALRAETYGAELSAQWQVMSRWRITGSYSGLRMHVSPDPSFESESPQQQAQLRSLIELPARVELNVAAMYMDSISVNPTGTPTRIPAYVRLDLGAIWRATDTLEIGVWGQNLLERQHPEFPSVQTSLQTQVPRSVLARANWRAVNDAQVDARSLPACCCGFCPDVRVQRCSSFC